jgi:hypothetical protein
MAYSKQELLDWINDELPEDAVVAFYAHEVGEEALIDDMLVDLADLEEDELLDLDLCMEDESATHLVFLV